MSKSLLTGRFKWIDTTEFDLNEYTRNSLKGCLLPVDLEYPKELSKLHNDYPLAPYKIQIERETLSKYQQLIPDFHKYVLHYENLQLHLRLGLKIKN